MKLGMDVGGVGGNALMWEAWPELWDTLRRIWSQKQTKKQHQISADVQIDAADAFSPVLPLEDSFFKL